MKASASKVKTNTLVVKSDDPTARDATPEERVARHVATVATVQATIGMDLWLTQCVGEPDFTALAHKIRDQTNAMHSGDMKEIESMLFAQALTLQATFTALSRKAAANANEYLAATDTYLRLALKAQGQCRATLETLANIKNPRPLAFVKQANISNGPQQVNNGTVDASETVVRAREETENRQNELLTDTRATHDNPLNNRATGKAGAGCSPSKTVGVVNQVSKGKKEMRSSGNASKGVSR